MLFKKCLFCNIDFEDKSRTKNKKFCSTNHQGKYRWQNNKDALLAYNKKYESENLQKVRTRKNQYRKEKYSSDPKFALAIKLRVRINRAIKNKKSKFLDLIGCSIDNIKSYIESKFQPGMTWDNYGKWEIDHIQPMTSFDLLSEKGQKEACHYTNLQPLWVNQNRAKNNKKTVLLVGGASGSGKSWVASNLDKSKYEILDSDNFSMNQIMSIIDTTNLIPVVFLTVGLSTFIKRNPNLYVQLILIKESEATIEQRLIGRGGSMTDSIKKRIKRLSKLEKESIYAGSSFAVLNYLRS